MASRCAPNSSPIFYARGRQKGARWNTEIAKELKSADVGVLFVTRDNINSAWLLYKSGALAKRLEKSRVCPIIFKLAPNDLPGPLRQFQATEFQEVDFRKLLKTINFAQSENKLADAVLNEVFEMWWPQLHAKFDGILNAEQLPEEEEPIRSDREILEEILALSRLRDRPRGSRIPPAAVRDLVEGLKNAVSAIQGDPKPQAALAALSSMCPPIRFLIRSSGSEMDELSTVVAELEFEYQPPDDDDEIPF